MTRRTRLGETHEPDQCMTLDEAIAAYTRVAAEVTGIGDRSGTLEEGKRADLVILDRELDDRTLADVKVRATILAAEDVYGTSRLQERL